MFEYLKTLSDKERTKIFKLVSSSLYSLHKRSFLFREFFEGESNSGKKEKREKKKKKHHKRRRSTSRGKDGSESRPHGHRHIKKERMDSESPPQKRHRIKEERM